MPNPYSPSIQKLIDEFAKLPGIGRRSAERVAFHVLSSSRAEAMELAVAIRDVKANIRACTRCFNVAEDELCAICADRRREHGLLCVVELPRDIIAMEKSGAFLGGYHVLQGHLSPHDNIGPEQLRIHELRRRIEDPQMNGGSVIHEVILALNPTMEGDVTASFLAQNLRDLPVRVTRLARGLATGSELESAAPSSLQYALRGRQAFAPEDEPVDVAGANAAKTANANSNENKNRKNKRLSKDTAGDESVSAVAEKEKHAVAADSDESDEFGEIE